MKISVCIPNYNYGRYLGTAIKSVLDQSYQDFEILVSDNASTDDSVQVVERFGDPRIQLRCNRVNLGYAPNVDRATEMARGDAMILLSSDDIVLPNGLSTYARVIDALGPRWGKCFLGSRMWVIDAEGNRTGENTVDATLWEGSVADAELSKAAGVPVRRIDATTLLRRSLDTLRTPISCTSSMYPRSLYDAIGGYAAARTYGPDKWFHWKLLSVAEDVYFIDAPLVAYRWHPQNQFAGERGVSALRFLVDDYLNSLEINKAMLDRTGLTREDAERAFVEHAVARHALATLARGDPRRARRIYGFGKSVYPQHMRRNRSAVALTVLLGLGVIGERVARLAYKSLGNGHSAGQIPTAARFALKRRGKPRFLERDRPAADKQI